MFKITWGLASQPYKNCFLIGNFYSVLECLDSLRLHEKTGGQNAPVNIEVWDLSGNKVDMLNKGIRVIGEGERTRD